MAHVKSSANENLMRQEMIMVCRRLAHLQLIGAVEGNVSARLDEQNILTTPSGANKILINEHELVVTNQDGEPINHGRKPSSELAMHLAIYRARPDVQAVVHAHPLTAIALTLAGVNLDSPLMPEAVTTLGGSIPTASYATPSTWQLAENVVKALGQNRACLMERHGAVSVGHNLWEACDRMETVERIAMVVHRCRSIGGNPLPLPVAEVKKLLEFLARPVNQV